MRAKRREQGSADRLRLAWVNAEILRPPSEALRMTGLLSERPGLLGGRASWADLGGRRLEVNGDVG